MTTTSTLSRRSMITAVATLGAAAAVPASSALSSPMSAEQVAEIATTEPAAVDPIIIAISEHKRRYREWGALCDVLDRAEGAARKVEPMPIPLVHWRNFFIGGSEIELRRDTLLKNRRLNPKKIEAEYKQKKAEERAKFRARRAWYNRHGLANLKAECDRANEEEKNALLALGTVRPTTAVGAGQLIAYVRHDLRNGDEALPWHRGALANAARALLDMPDEALPPFSRIQRDLALVNATHEMHSQDGAIDRLHKQFGDDADERADYHHAQHERYKALKILTKVRSKTSSGLVAKAKALIEPRIIEDNEQHGNIAVSLAEDVLRYFSADAA
jgi:hypothetical protein